MTLQDAQGTPAQHKLRSAAGVRSRPRPSPRATSLPSPPVGHLNPAAAVFQPPGPPAPADRPPNLLAAQQEASGRAVRASEPAQGGRAPGTSFDPGFAQREQAARAARVAAQAGSPQAGLDGLVAWNTREQWDGALRGLTRAMGLQSKERWTEALATALQDPGGDRLYRRWDPPTQDHKPRIYGSVRSRTGLRRVQVLLDSGATTSFINTALADQLGLPEDGALGPTVARSANGELTSCRPPVTTHLALGSRLQEELALAPFPIGTGDDIILGWDWMQGHDLRFLYADGAADVTTGEQRIQLSLFPTALQTPPGGGVESCTVLSQGALRRMLRTVVPHAGATTAECNGLFADGFEDLRDGTTLFLATLGVVDGELRLEGKDDPAFAPLIAKYQETLGGPPKGLPPDRGIELVLETGDAPMPRSRPLKRLSAGELEELRAQVNQLLDYGWIRHSTAGHAAAVVFARKPDNTWRICYDYRGLNAITRKAIEPIPHIEALLDATQGAGFFTKLDLASAYNQFGVRAEDRWKTSFRCPIGQFEWNVMPYGLQGASSVLQRYMNRIFRAGLGVAPDGLGGVPGGGSVGPATGPLGRCVVVYFDDILVFSLTKEQHLLDVAEVLEILKRNQLYAKRSKCEFGRTEVAFLGHVLSKDGVKVDPRKTDVVRAWATPSSTADVRQFIGLTNYYRRFVPKYAELAAPLTALCSPAQAFEWTAEAQASFEALKTRLTTAPVLRTHDPQRRCQVVTDACGLAVSVILTQPDDEGVQHPIAYESRKLTVSERKYSAYAGEMLAVVHALKVFRHYLLAPGGPRPPGVTTDFDLLTDNNSLTWLQTCPQLSPLHARWLDRLQEFSFSLFHLPGKLNPADPLSRMAFPSGTGPAPCTGYTEPGCEQELFAVRRAAGPAGGRAGGTRAGGPLTPPNVTPGPGRAGGTRVGGPFTPSNATPGPGRAGGTRAGGPSIPPTGTPQLRPSSDTPGGPTGAFVRLADADLRLHEGTLRAGKAILDPDARFLSPTFVEGLLECTRTDPFFGPISLGATASPGQAVDSLGRAVRHADSGRSRRSGRADVPRGGSFVIRCGLLYREGQGSAARLCIPDGGELRLQVMRDLHDSPLAGHFGRDKTTALARRLVYWPGMTQTVADYVASCPICQRVKADHTGPRGLFHALPLPSLRGGMWGIDFIGPLQASVGGFNLVQTHIDHLSGKVVSVPTRDTATAEEAAKIFMDVCLRNGTGVPDVVVVDHDIKFRGKFFTAFAKGLGSALIVGSAYHKNTGARVERINGVVGDGLRAFVNGRGDDWDRCLPFVDFAINNSESTVEAGMTPFFIDRGEHPRMPLSHGPTGPAESGMALAARMRQITEQVRALMLAQQQERKELHDPHRRAVTFQTGDRVLLATRQLTELAQVGKLRHRWAGPFEVMDSPAPNTYALRLPRSMRISPVINVDRLKLYRDRGDLAGPVVDAAGEAEVEIIVRRRTFRGRVQYLVRWRGADSSWDEWWNAANLPNCQELITDFEARRGAAAPGGGRPRRAHAGGLAPPAVPATPPAAARPSWARPGWVIPSPDFGSP